MSKQIMLLLLFLIILLGTTTGQLSFYKLSLQWPTSYCASARNPPCAVSVTNVGVFTIHGLWPQTKDDKGVPPYDPKNPCTAVTPTDPKLLIGELDDTLKKALTGNWPNLTHLGDSESNELFWVYEWTKHGMCSMYSDDPNGYFEKALELQKANNVLNMLATAGIKPGGSKTAQDISNAIWNGLHKLPQVSCKKTANRPKTLQLLEVRLCFDKQFSNPMDCPSKFSGCVANDTSQFP